MKFFLIHSHKGDSLQQHQSEELNLIVDTVNKNIQKFGAKNYQFQIFKGREIELEIDSVQYKGFEYAYKN